jgi:hypothetical protein
MHCELGGGAVPGLLQPRPPSVLIVCLIRVFPDEIWTVIPVRCVEQRLCSTNASVFLDSLFYNEYEIQIRVQICG